MRFRRMLPWLILLASVMTLFLRAEMGIDWSDESFTLATIHRFWRGDLPLIDEWHRTQFFSLIMVPLYTLFRSVRGSSDGVYLFFRGAYVLWSLLLSARVYVVLKRHGSRWAALACALISLWYAKLNIATFSYNTGLFQCLLAAMIEYYDVARGGSTHPVRLMLCGVALGVACVALPHMAILYIIALSFATGARALRRMQKRSATCVCWTVVGTALVASYMVITLLPVLRAGGLVQETERLLSDPEMGRIGLATAVRLARLTIKAYGVIPFSISVFLFLASVLLAIRRVKQDGVAVICVVLLSFAAAVAMGIHAFSAFGLAPLALTPAGLVAFMHTKRKDWAAFWTLYIPGVLVGILSATASNTEVFALANGMTISAVAAVLFAFQWSAERVPASIERRTVLRPSGAVYACIWMVIAILVAGRLTLVYRDAPIQSLRARIDRGPYQGIYTTAKHRDQYEEAFNALRMVKRNDRILISKQMPWGYVATDAQCAAFTTWSTALDDPRLPAYYQTYPARTPTCALVLNPDIGAFERTVFNQNGAEPNANDHAGSVWEMLQSKYEKIKLPIGVLYTLAAQQSAGT